MENKQYICPVCGKQGRIMTIVPHMDTTRYDLVVCECTAEWRVYYKFENAFVELMYAPKAESVESTESCDHPECKDTSVEG